MPPELAVVVAVAVAGACVVMFVCVVSILRWDDVSGFAHDPDSGWARLMVAAYLPAVLWGPLLLGVTWDYWTRRRQ